MSLPAAMDQLVLAVLQGTGLLAILAIATGSLRHSSLSPLRQSLLLGALFGLTSLLLQAFSASPQSGLVLDGRFMGSALAAAFGGLPALGVAAALTALGQIWAAEPSVAELLGPGLIGLVALYWRWRIRPAFGSAATALVLLGLMLAVPLVLLHSLSAYGLRQPPPYVWVAAATATVLLALTVGIVLEHAKVVHLREQALREASLRDPMTGLHNRRSFDAELGRVLARPGDHYLLFVDVDHFKKVNDQYGHGFGDEVLRTIAGAMSLSVRNEDIVARIGGEEFALILPGSARHVAQTVAERLLLAVPACDLWAGGERVTITVSIGVARRRTGHSAATLMGVADAALYKAKSQGRRRAVFCEEQCNAPLPASASDGSGVGT